MLLVDEREEKNTVRNTIVFFSPHFAIRRTYTTLHEHGHIFHVTFQLLLFCVGLFPRCLASIVITNYKPPFTTYFLTRFFICCVFFSRTWLGNRNLLLNQSKQFRWNSNAQQYHPNGYQRMVRGSEISPEKWYISNWARKCINSQQQDAIILMVFNTKCPINGDNLFGSVFIVCVRCIR